MSAPTLCVVGTDATMVYDALHNVIAERSATSTPPWRSRTSPPRTSPWRGDSTLAAVLEALYTPPFLVERRVVVVRDAQLLVADEVAQLSEWMRAPAPGTFLIARGRRREEQATRQGRRPTWSRSTWARASPTASPSSRPSLGEYRVTLDRATAQRVAEQVGDDVARVDALARTL